MRTIGIGIGDRSALAAGQALTSLALTMSKGAVVSGTVKDDFGPPVASAPVRLMQLRRVNGEPMLTGQNTAMIDDRGMYRAFGLPASVRHGRRPACPAAGAASG